MAILSEVATQVLVPLAAVVGVAFAVAQWVIVSRVKLAPSSRGARDKDALGDSLIEEEEGLNDHNVVVKCAEIQSAIAEGEFWLDDFSTAFF
jgi:H+-translocating diphosphatase